MRAVLCKRYGRPDTLVIEDVPLPHPKAGELVVQVYVASVDFPDTLIIGNRYQLKP